MKWRSDQTKLSQAQELYNNAVAEHLALDDKIKKAREQYHGSNVADILPGEDSADNFAYVYNITMFLIEGGVKTSVPLPKVTPHTACQHGVRLARRVENLIRIILDDQDTEEFIDAKERATRVCGSCGTNVEWDETITTQSSFGGVDVMNIPADYIFPQPGCLNEDDCDYIFVRYNTTKAEIARKYGLSDKALDELASADPRNDYQASVDTDSASLIVMWYRNDDGNICKYAWSDETELEDNDDFYSRKVERCKNCGRRGSECRADPCDHPVYYSENLEYEELTEDVKCSDGRVIPATSPIVENGEVVTEMRTIPVTDDMGNIVLDENGMPATIEVEVPKMQPTRLPFYKPKKYPISIRRNIHDDQSIWGISDCEIIRPQQQAVNKLTCRIMEACMQSGAILFKPEDADIEYTNDGAFAVVDVKEGMDRSQYGEFAYSLPIQQYVAERAEQFEMAKKNVGISDLYSGQSDNTAKSGYAKQLQINQSASRQEPRRVLAEADAARIYRSIFELYLAFSDEPREVHHDDLECETAMAEMFNRYDFYDFDVKTGKWFINDKFTFSVDHSVQPAELREQLWQMQSADYAAGLYGVGIDAVITLWKLRERTGYPNAHLVVEQMKRMRDAQMQAAQQTAQNTNGSQNASTGATDGADKEATNNAE